MPPIPKAAQTAWSREAPKAKASKAARAALKQSGGQPVNPLVRARRIRIDPRKWGRRKIIYDETSAEAERRAAGIWECEDVIDENGEAKAIWVFKSKDGNVRRRDIVNLTRRSTPHTDRFTALLEGLNRPVTHPEPGLTNRQSSPIIHDPQFPTVDIEHTKERLSKRRKSLSPPPYIPSAPRTLLYNDEDTFALLESTQDSEELEATRKRERAKQLELLASLLTESEVPATAERSTIDQKFEVVAIEKPRLTSRGRVEGYAEDSDDEDFFKSLKRPQAAMQSTRLTLRGGAASPSSDESTDSDFDSESTDGREEGDDRDADAVANVGSTAKSMKDIKMQPVRPKTMLVKGSLKDMFKPKEKEAESKECVVTRYVTGLTQLVFLLRLFLFAQRSRSRTGSPRTHSVPTAGAAGASVNQFCTEIRCASALFRQAADSPYWSDYTLLRFSSGHSRRFEWRDHSR